jgi:hypothetical protein
MKDFIHSIKNRYLRWRYGAGCCDCYSYYYFIAPTLAKGIEEFRKYCYNNSTPSGLTVKKWDNILKEMVWAFNYINNERDDGYNEEKERRCDKGLKLFGKYFRDLWW